MANMAEGYPFIFQMNDRTNADELLEYTLQYRFKSEKSHHTYIVRVERYKEHSYCLKFFDKANMLSKDKFSLRTNTFEPRTIFYTLLNIMLDVYRRDTKASFFFIGANDEKDEPGVTSRRFKIYQRFVLSTIGDDVFKHYRVNELSLYILANRNSVKDMDAYTNNIIDCVREVFGINR
jgi:hypothetical protein